MLPVDNLAGVWKYNVVHSIRETCIGKPILTGKI